MLNKTKNLNGYAESPLSLVCSHYCLVKGKRNAEKTKLLNGYAESR